MDVKRSIYDQLVKELSKPEVLILVGARQVGKTFLLNELEKHVKSKKKRSKYYNLELPRDALLFNKDIEELYEEITQDADYLFIDEFQYFENASKFFKAIFDDRKLNIKVIASGSSALEMHKHLKESLAGRKIEKIIYPLDYSEYKQSKQSFEEYLQFGALPGLLNKKGKEEKTDLLGNLLSTYILKDVKSLIKEEHVPAFNNLIYLLADYQGQVVSTNNLANELKIDNKTVERYLTILEQTFVIFSLHSFSKNLSNELKKSKKYYLYDSGIRNFIINNFKGIKDRDDKGKIYEAYVHNFFKYNAPKYSELRFWRTRNQEEVDLIFINNQDVFAIEVKSKLKTAEIPEGLKKFIRSYPKIKKAFVINENLSEKVHYESAEVHFIPIERIESNKELLEIMQ